jgi:hypothetical protein
LTYGIAAEFLGLRIPVLIGVALCVIVWLYTWSRIRHMAPILEGSGGGI